MTPHPTTLDPDEADYLAHLLPDTGPKPPHTACGCVPIFRPPSHFLATEEFPGQVSIPPPWNPFAQKELHP